MFKKLTVASLRHWLKSESDNRHIFVGMAWVASFVLIAKLAAAAKEMAVAWRYGISEIVDAYLFVMNLLSWPVGVWMSVLSVVLIPLAARIKKQSPEDLPVFRAELLSLTAVVGTVLSTGSFFGLPVLLRSRWVGLPVHTAEIAVAMIPALSWLILLGVLIGLYSTWTMSEGRHANTLFEGVPAVGILLTVLLFGGIGPLLWGTIGGALAQLVCLVGPFSAKGAIERPVLKLCSPYWEPFRRGFGIMLAGSFLMSLSGVIDQFFAARLGEGAISMLGYANRILSLVITLGATAVTRATLPIFSEVRARSSGQTTRDDPAMRWSTIMFGVGLLAAVAGWVLAPWAVKILFERGHFTAGNTVSTSAVLRVGMMQLPFYFSSLVWVSAYSSRSNYKPLFLSGLVGLSVKLLVNFLLIGKFSINVLMISSAVMYFSNLMLFLGLKYFTHEKIN